MIFPQTFASENIPRHISITDKLIIAEKTIILQAA
jgi:hypothetical protein